MYAHAGVHPAQLAELNNQATMWLIVAIAGFWFGAGFVTGPLAWIYGGRLRDKYRALGLAPSSSATGAWGVGIATAIVSWMAILAVVFLLTFVFGSLAAL
jgi:hypothetical protein